jgi:CheY-like chemotaxis protein
VTTATPNSFEEVVIILVEDDPGHALLIEKNLRRASIHNEVLRLTDGQQALDFLFPAGAEEGARPRVPLLVLLDLNMPGVSGYEVLERMKARPETRAIPVIVLTTADDPREVNRCYALGCNVFITKPVDYVQFSEAIRRLGLFLAVVRTPELEPGAC